VRARGHVTGGSALGRTRSSTVPIIELVSYVIIGIATFLVVATIVFLGAINFYEWIDAWRIERAARRQTRQG
jgi:hypothetical protein